MLNHNPNGETSVKPRAVAEPSPILSTEKGWGERLASDMIVVATTPKPNQELYNLLRNVAHEIKPVGDCVKLPCIADAIFEGFRIGQEN